MSGRQRARALGCAAAFVGLVLSGAARGEGECASWPGEPLPLPDAGHADPVISRWAMFRAAELAVLAQDAEARSRSVAHALWRHVECLDGERPELAEALTRTRPVRVTRPALVWLREAAPGPRTGPAGAADRLGDPIALVGLGAPRPDVASGGPAALARAETALAEAERALSAARFADALERVDRTRSQLPTGAGSPPALRNARGRLEVAGATAALALGREREARQRFERALALDPELELDPANHSPKVHRLFREVRDGASPAPRTLDGALDGPTP